MADFLVNFVIIYFGYLQKIFFFEICMYSKLLQMEKIANFLINNVFKVLKILERFNCILPLRNMQKWLIF